MRYALWGLMWLLTTGMAQAAPVNVMIYGDSTSVAYANQLPALRPDLTIYNRAQPGDVSWNLARFDAALAERTWEHVVIMIGTNDVYFVPDYDPHQTFQNIWTMAQRAKNAGAEVWLMTQTPCAPPCAAISQRHTLAVANKLAHRDLNNSHSHVTFLYLRDEFTIRDWAAYAFPDGIHPNLPGAQFIAQFVANALP